MMNLYSFKSLKIVVVTIISLTLFSGYSYSQNIAVTDSSAYVADSTAMLDVQSSDKGMLVPRMTTTQRMAIDQPADGLLVYDKNYKTFFFYEQDGWVSVPSVSSTTSSDSALFHVTNASGDTVFAVYNDGVEITVTDTSKGKVGGFAVSGRSSGKGTKRQIMSVTPDSTVIVVNDSSAKGKVGGFAVSGRSSGKATVQDIFTANQDSTRIYVDNSNKKGKVGGFAVSGRSSGKGTASKFMNLAPENYFIGHQSGKNITTGSYNSFFGFESGYSNTTGSENVFMGRRSGYSNTDGYANVFIGNNSGYLNENGIFNIFIGRHTGFSNTSGDKNIIIGDYAGNSNTEGIENVIIGDYAGASNTIGDNNVFLGKDAGWSTGDRWAIRTRPVNGYHRGRLPPGRRYRQNHRR